MARKKLESGVSYDRLQEQAERLVALLKDDREVGRFGWHMLLNERLKTIHDLLCPLFNSK